jgi:hypothetical protein
MQSRFNEEFESEAQRRREQYLTEITRSLPKIEQPVFRTEAEQHLDALIAAYEDLGHTREEAMELALARFGDARTLGHHLGQEAMRTEFKQMLSPRMVRFVVPVVLYFTTMAFACLLLAGTEDEKLRLNLSVFAAVTQYISPVLGGVWLAQVVSRLPHRASALAFTFWMLLGCGTLDAACCVAPPCRWTLPILPHLALWLVVGSIACFFRSKRLRMVNTP